MCSGLSAAPSRPTARVAEQILEHRSVGDRGTVVVSKLGDDGAALEVLRDSHGFTTLAQLRSHEDIDWRTVEHRTHLEYSSSIDDLRAESSERATQIVGYAFNTALRDFMNRAQRR